MTENRKTEPTQLSEDDLDQANGGYELKNVMVTSYQTSGSAESVPTEEVAFNYSEIKRKK